MDAVPGLWDEDCEGVLERSQRREGGRPLAVVGEGSPRRFAESRLLPEMGAGEEAEEVAG